MVLIRTYQFSKAFLNFLYLYDTETFNHYTLTQQKMIDMIYFSYKMLKVQNALHNTFHY